MIINIAIEVVNLNVYDSKNTIWYLIEKFKNSELDLTLEKYHYKDLDTIIQPIKLLSNSEIFCVKYKNIKGCSHC